MKQWEIPKLAADGLCANTECSIRWTDQCPVKRLLDGIATPVKNNVINLANQRWEKAGFRKKTYDWYRPRNVIWLEEWRRWIELEKTAEKEDSLDVVQQIMDILTQKNIPTQTAQVIQFPKINIA